MGYIGKIRQKVGSDAIFMPAVGCFIYKRGKILLQRRRDNNKWAASGGAMELGEDFLETLEREVSEELGVIPLRVELVNFYAGKDRHFIYPNGDEVYGVMGIYLVREYEGEVKIDPGEVAEARWFSVDNLPTRDEIHDPDFEPLVDTVKMIQELENYA